MTVDFESTGDRPFSAWRAHSQEISGINLIGYATHNFGIGNSFRHIASALLAKGIPIRIHDLAQQVAVQGRDDSLTSHFVEQMRELPFEVNLFCLNIMALPDLLLRIKEDELAWDKRLNVAVVFWELPVLPPHWLPAIAAFDVVLCSSWFIRESIGWQVPGTVPLHLHYPLSMPEIPRMDRTSFGIPRDAYAFYFSFDPFSGMDRKNPYAVLQAFRQAFDGAGNTHLVIKLNAPSADSPALSADARRFIAECASTPHVTLISRSISYAETLGLCQACCDCYVSLHRSEGLGLGPMEAMLLGKPVILTAWSGNMSYAPAYASCLVPCGLVRPDGMDAPQFESSFLGARARWAAPRVASAAYWMKRLATEPAFAAQLAAQGRQHVARYVAEAAECRFVDELSSLYVLKKSHGFGVPPLEESQRRILRSRKAHFGLRVQRLRRLLTNHVPGFWRLFRWMNRPGRDGL
ncbi:MAG TPA: glycosyltransferase [Burkholderiaceae bacterium]|nr:glycosyltransferase [Burkholderiaceae bacterium]